MPPSACSNLPFFLRSAPVKAPFSWPNSSLSRSDSVSAAQLKATHGPRLREASAAWRAWATSSLPVPVSPWISTVEPSGPTCSIRSKILRIFGLFETMLWKL